MTLVTRRDNGNRFITRSMLDPGLALARELFGWDAPGEQPRTSAAYAPRFEVMERADVFVFRADVPGVKEADLDISMREGVLTITGSRAAEPKQEGETFYVYERDYGTFSRGFALPEVADVDKVEARLAEGVLTVKIGKKSAAQPRRIGIKKD